MKHTVQDTIPEIYVVEIIRFLKYHLDHVRFFVFLSPFVTFSGPLSVVLLRTDVKRNGGRGTNRRSGVDG